MCQVHIGAYICLTSYSHLEKQTIDLTACHARKTTTYRLYFTYSSSIWHVVVVVVVVVAVVVVDDLTLIRNIKSVVTGQAPVTGAEEYPKTHPTQGGTRIPGISQLTQCMPPPETYKSEIGS